MQSMADAPFGLNRLLSQLPELTSRSPFTLERVEFGHSDFAPPDSEQTIEVHRGRREDFDSLLHFWVQSLQSQDWNPGSNYDNYVKTSDYRPLSEESFVRVVLEHSRSLTKPLPALPLGEFIAGLQMHSQWNEVSVVAEYEQEFVAFYWATTA